jgi:hypothetical protein
MGWSGPDDLGLLSSDKGCTTYLFVKIIIREYRHPLNLTSRDSALLGLLRVEIGTGSFRTHQNVFFNCKCKKNKNGYLTNQHKPRSWHVLDSTHDTIHADHPASQAFAGDCNKGFLSSDIIDIDNLAAAIVEMFFGPCSESSTINLSR